MQTFDLHGDFFHYIGGRVNPTGGRSVMKI